MRLPATDLSSFLFGCLPHTGGSSPPYIGSGLGFGVTRILQVCPYDIIYFLGRLEPVAMILYRRCPIGGTVHQAQLCGTGPPVRNCRLVRPSSAQPDVCVRVDAGGLIQPAGRPSRLAMMKSATFLFWLPELHASRRRF